MIDLQVHTTFSDGAWSLEKVLEEAKRKRISYLAITDHDTIGAVRTSNLEKVFAYFDKTGIDRTVFGEAHPDCFVLDDLVVIQGSEISCNYGNNEIHVLAYFLDEGTFDKTRLGLHTPRMERANVERIKYMAQRLADDGYVVNFNEMAQSVSSPHAFTRELLAKHLLMHNDKRLRAEIVGRQGRIGKIVSDVRNVILSRDGKYYAHISDFGFYRDESGNSVPFPTMEDAVVMILECGGVPVLSHPGRYDFIERSSDPDHVRRDATGPIVLKNASNEKVPAEKIVRDLLACSYGLAGIEVYNFRHNFDETKFWNELAVKNGMLITAGSDFHDDRDNSLGLPGIPDQFVYDLFAAREKVRSMVKTTSK